MNHNGSFELACKLVDIAKKAGVDCIKFQTFKPEKLVSYNANGVGYSVLQWSNLISFTPLPVKTFIAILISSMLHIPVDKRDHKLIC